MKFEIKYLTNEICWMVGLDNHRLEVFCLEIQKLAQYMLMSAFLHYTCRLSRYSLDRNKLLKYLKKIKAYPRALIVKPMAYITYLEKPLFFSTFNWSAEINIYHTFFYPNNIMVMCISKTEKKDNEDVYNTTIYSSVSKYSYNVKACQSFTLMTVQTNCDSKIFIFLKVDWTHLKLRKFSRSI